MDQTTYAIQSAVSRLTRNGVLVNRFVGHKPAGVIYLKQPVGLKLLGPVDFLVRHDYVVLKGWHVGGITG